MVTGNNDGDAVVYFFYIAIGWAGWCIPFLYIYWPRKKKAMRDQTQQFMDKYTKGWRYGVQPRYSAYTNRERDKSEFNNNMMQSTSFMDSNVEDMTLKAESNVNPHQNNAFKIKKNRKFTNGSDV